MDILTNPTSQERNIARKAADYVLRIFDEKHDNRLVFHNYHLGISCSEQIQRIQADQELSPAIAEIAQLVCWFLPVGYLFNYDAPLNYSLRELGRFFSQEDYPEQDRKKVIQCLQTIGHGRKPVRLDEKLVSDAIHISGYLNDFPARMEYLRLEKKLMQGSNLDDEEWSQFQYQFLMDLRLYLPYTRKHARPILNRELLRLQKEQTQKAESVAESDRFKIEKKGPSRGAQTFFRTNFRNHINLSAIADKKSHIMISVNAIMISVLITFLSYRNMAETQPMILLPVTLFLVTGLVSLIFAVLSARPNVTKHLQHPNIDQLLNKNLIFFGNFVQLELPDFEEAMDRLLKSDQLLYGNLVRDLYFLGKVLDKKYRYLSVSYNVFMLGFAITVISFLVIFLV
jgi:hypothetical protein